MRCTGDDEGEPHSEKVYLQRWCQCHWGLEQGGRTSRSWEEVKASTDIPINFVRVIPQITYKSNESVPISRSREEDKDSRRTPHQ